MQQPIYKSAKLDHVSYDVRGPVLEEAEKMMAAGLDILQLNTGNPAPFGFTAPEELLREFAARAGNGQGYSESRGLVEAREAIVQNGRDKGLPNVGMEDVYTGNGVSELIMICMQALLNNGDEILLPSPDYPLWTAAATLSGGKVVHYRCDESARWYPDIADIRQKITPHTRALVVINPNNPTGVLYPREILEALVEVAREHGLIIFSDEIYECLVMDGKKHIPIASLAPDLFVVTMNGLSKSHRIAGFRVGWMSLSGDKSRARDYIQGLNMLASMRLCSNVPAQYIIKIALENYFAADELLKPGGRLYEQRAFIYDAIEHIPGLTTVYPDAAFYMFPKIDVKRCNLVDDEQFVLDFLREHKILMVHGRGFNWFEPDHFRLVYLPCLEELKMVAERLARFMETYQQKPALGRR
jgi:alanine-synthesizing transaminase